jgi:hypothetical protein
LNFAKNLFVYNYTNRSKNGWDLYGSPAECNSLEKIRTSNEKKTDFTAEQA